MATVFHPTFADVSREVPDDAVAEWTAAGWRKTPLSAKAAPRKPRKPAARKPAKTKTPTARAGVPVVVAEPTEVAPERTPA